MAPTKDPLLSSPDPLGMSNGSISAHSPTKRGRQPLTTPRKALKESSGNSQVQEFYIDTPPNLTRNASPTKSPRHTKSASPWRIRLTVQAEQVNEMQKPNKSPVKRLAEQTTTITVPLKGGDDTPPVEKKGRGRPRKSLDGSVKRSGTRKPKAGGGRKTMPESPKKQETDAYSETATPPKKSRGRPRKSMDPKDMVSSPDLSQKNGLDVWLGSSVVGGEETAEKGPKTSRTRSRGRRQEITPMKIAVDSDIESNSGISCGQATPGQTNEEGWRQMNLGDTRSPGQYGDHVQDPTDQHQEYDSILESEGFSMVSVSSLPSVGNNSDSPPPQYGSMHEHTPIIASSPLVPPAPEIAKVETSPRQLEIPSDGTPKLAKVLRAGNALQGVLSPIGRNPELGSPFQEPQRPSPFLTVEKSVHQPALLHHSAKDKSPGDVFRGFGAGTRRELKAGLRLGEELAKRQQQISQELVEGPKEGNDIFQQTSSPKYPQLPASDFNEGYSLKAPGSEMHVRYPMLSNYQLPSPETSSVDEEEDHMSWKADTPIKKEAPASKSAQILVSDESIGPNVSAVDYTMMARQEEWQREREAVSKQIEMANKSQVIIIDSDDEVEEEENQDQEENIADSDIWQAEAQSADQSRETTPEAETTLEASDFLLQPEILKPRRSKLPSPWRRNSQVVYSDELEPTESDLFWQPDQSRAKVSQRRSARKGQPQECLGVRAGSVFEDSLEVTRKAEAQIQLEASEGWPVEGSLLSDDEDSTAATSADCKSHHSSIQNAERTTSSVVAVPREDHTMPERPPTPKKASIRDVKDVSDITEKITTLNVTEGTSVEPISLTSKDSKAVIDPRLFQKKTRLSSAPIDPIQPIQPLQPMQSSNSWLSRLTAPIWSVFAPAASLPLAATKEDILCSSPHEPLCQLTPWEECHFRALGPLYYGSFLYGAHLFPFNPRSPSARYCGSYVTTELGWSRKITPEDCGITDAFMDLLDERGFALGEPGARWIDEEMVVTMCVALWVGMVKRGEIEIDRSKGERIGLRDQGDRKWTKDDIDWASNQCAYFERKRREFDGLPSWKNKA